MSEQFQPRLVGDTPSGGSVMSFYLPKGAQRPLRIARGEGVYLYDEAGKPYLDATSGAVVSNLGHSNPRVVAAMIEQAQRVTFAYPRFFESEHNVRLADRLTGLAGEGFERAFFVSGGSEANESALKLARQYAVARGEGTRFKVIARDPSYHGSTMGAMAVTGDSFTESIYGPMMRTMPKIPAPLTYRLAPGISAEEHVAACAQALEAKILEEGPQTVLAFIIEPIGGLSSGALVSPASYYCKIREICDRYGVLLIHDEIMSGAGRSGAFLSSQHWQGSRPDIVTLAKGLAAGYTPFGAVLAPNRIVETIAAQGGFVHGHTYFSNPFSCAVAAAVLDEVVEQGLVGRAARMGAYLDARLRDLQTRSRLIGDVRGKGLLMAIELVADKETRRSLPAAMNAPARLTQYGLAHGIALYNRRANRGEFGDMQLIAPPLIVTEPQIDELIDQLERSLADFERDLQREGLLR
ncbi:putative aminotransferase [Burkholderia multivorans]|uniref:aminotransferase family protein n=1 Tax=Burkholderia multivorans TaxID=87883 RepID=UPI0019C1B329|nr:aspartate aminotransferase family protein [Burkholderia multivorans]CAB5280713.1 putative aminotransferase [Burkholderia multivorans]CAB5297084.1 putative aminotransferase [Burkholderia multivorans]CAB5298022.1 putative aminotransferase [Burkholderia multivorans]CAB5298750.1 putative aminotransferase [Burkholderia multivorans]CAB5314221.1 putative aminotransferase [Burkholderia multivorans]